MWNCKINSSIKARPFPNTFICLSHDVNFSRLLKLNYCKKEILQEMYESIAALLQNWISLPLIEKNSDQIFFLSMRHFQLHNSWELNCKGHTWFQFRTFHTFRSKCVVISIWTKRNNYTHNHSKAKDLYNFC